MKDLKISVNKETRYVNLSKSIIGVDGENLQEKIVFSFEDEFVDGTARLEFENTDGKQYVLLEKENEIYSVPVKNVITKEGNIKMQLVITEGTDEENIPVFKSNQFYLWCEKAINAVKEAPDSYELWIETANEKLNEVDNLDIDLVEEEKETKIIITRKDGAVKETTIAGGDKGVSSYPQLKDLPTINGVELIGNLTSEDLKLSDNAVIVYDVIDTKEVVRQKLLSLLDEKGNLNKNAYLINDGEMLFVLERISFEAENAKTFVFKSSSLIDLDEENIQEQKSLYEVELHITVPEDENEELIIENKYGLFPAGGSSDIELITELNPEDIENDLKPKQVYNGNAIHDLARLFGERIAGVKGSVEELEGKTIFDVSCDISLVDMAVSNVSNFSEEIIEKRNEGNLVRLNCNFVENPNLKVSTLLEIVDNTVAFFYPLIRGDIGSGTKNYLFRLGIREDSAFIEAHELKDINIIQEFDLEGEYSEEDVYGVYGIHNLMEVFANEITMIQEAVNENDDRLTALETVASELEEI